MTGAAGQIAAQRVIPVIRDDTVDDAVATARACAAAGMRVVELTHSVPDVCRALTELRGEDLTLGVGTITAATQVERVAAAGAAFVVSFTHPDRFVATAARAGVAAVPGAFTPTEVAACADAGAELVKLFPARLLTPGYLRDLRAVLPDVEVMVTGGVSSRDGDIAAWLRAGAAAIGLGGDLGTAAGVGAAEVQRRARRAMRQAHSAPARSSR